MAGGQVFKDADPALFTFQCDANCQQNNLNTTDNTGIMQYVDDKCGAHGGIGCEGDTGGQTVGRPLNTP